MLLHKLNQEEQNLQNQLKVEFEKKTFENLLHVTTIKNSLKNAKKKIKISGMLKDNINYNQQKEGRELYAMYGIAFAFILIAIVCLAQILIFGIVNVELSLTLFICFSIIIGLFYVHKLFFKTPR
jgi:hypothetical protein